MSREKSQSVVVIAEMSQGQLAPVTWELLSCAREICGLTGLLLRVVILGGDVGVAASELAGGGAQVTAVQGPGLAAYRGEAWRQVLAGLLPQMGPAYILAAHTTQGLDFAPGLALRLGAACLSGVEQVAGGDDGPLFSRTTFHGKVVAQYASLRQTTLLTVQPGVFEAQPPAGAAAGAIEILDAPPLPGATRSLGQKRAVQQSAALAQAQVVVAAGRGMGKKENLEFVERLAAYFSGAAVAGSRPVCDAGWLDYSRQVGITGATVAPRLYIACGISGARQHTAGMAGSGFIVAISSDPHAAIFNVSDVCVVEDLAIFIPALLEELSRSQA